MGVLRIDDFVESMHGLIKIYDIMEYLLINVVSVFEFPQVDALRGTNNLNFSLSACQRRFNLQKI